MNFSKTMLLLPAVLLFAPLGAAEWMTDFDAAKARAKAEKKAILVDFTGSDWCSACKQLHAKVLSTPDFEVFADKNFVLLEVDVPMHPTFGEEQLKKNKALVKQFHVQGFPTLLVLSPEGRVAGGFVGARSSFVSTRGILEAGLANVKVLSKAEKTKDAAKKAERLSRVYRSLGEDIRPCAAELREEMMAAAPDNAAALAHEKEVERQRQEMGADTVTLYNKTPQQMLELVQKYEGSVYPENRLAFLQIKMTALLFNAESVADLEQAKATLLQDAATLPDKEPVLEQINRQFADPATLLQRMQEFKKELQQQQ